ncbi:hypothetical protein PanWU01x14_137180 [Parasponia andersonii]|uniref:Uncharacterized protein n=1 Tax=Parasponia andersonii TaxID=3476 RepID=A0A2P5CNH1_PARAD|nr:hypothetical protein PanWU01x14_137180 [Parasponia andersonii]
MANKMMPKCGNCFLSLPSFFKGRGRGRGREREREGNHLQKMGLTPSSLFYLSHSKCPLFLTMILLPKSCDTSQPQLFLCSLSTFATHRCNSQFLFLSFGFWKTKVSSRWMCIRLWEFDQDDYPSKLSRL